MQFVDIEDTNTKEFNMKNLICNNAKICGEILESPVYDFSCGSHDFYRMIVGVMRKSNTVDKVPVVFQNDKFNPNEFTVGACVNVLGTFRSHNKRIESKLKLLLYLYADSITLLDAEACDNTNDIELAGYVCKEPVCRYTPKGKTVTEIFLAVPSTFNRTFYIPCISWGSVALFASEFSVGDFIKVNGRFQSREYTKKLENGESCIKTAYEVSVYKVNRVSDDNNDTDAVTTVSKENQ